MRYLAEPIVPPTLQLSNTTLTPQPCVSIFLESFFQLSLKVSLETVSNCGWHMIARLPSLNLALEVSFTCGMFMWVRGLQTVACGPNPAREPISSGRKRHFVNNEITNCYNASMICSNPC